MPSYLVRVCLLLSALVAAGVAEPARANWRQTLIHGVLPALAKRAAVSLIEKELYDLEEPDNVQNGRTSPSQSREDARWQSYSPRPEWRIPSRAASASPSGSNSSIATDSPYAAAGTSKAQFKPGSLKYLPDAGFDQQWRAIKPDSVDKNAFVHGNAGNLSYEQLVDADVFAVCPLHGSVFKRERPVKYIILHSTETGSPADARRVIQSWNNRGLRHPGAQFVVDRDGTICSTTNPDMATIHINIHKTLAGYTNDNSVGIEIVRSGKQRYTQPQLNSVMYLVAYLQAHYHVDDGCVTTHHHVQPSDRSDPVGFDLLAFQNAKRTFGNQALAWSNRQANTSPPMFSLSPPDQGTGTTHSAHVHKTWHHVAQVPQPAPDFRRLPISAP